MICSQKTERSFSVWLPLSVHVCVMREETGFFTPRSLNSDSLNSFLKEVLDTHQGHLHTWTHIFQEWKVCYENMLMIWLWLSASPCVCTTPWVIFDITTGCVFVCFTSRKLKGNPYLSVVCYVWFFSARLPQILQIFRRSSLLNPYPHRDIESLFLLLKQCHKPLASFNEIGCFGL